MLPERGEQVLQAGRRYKIFGLSIQSEIALPDLDEVRSEGSPDVAIRLGRVPRLLDGEEPQGLSVSANGAILNMIGVARYWITGGSEVLVEPCSGATERNLRLFLLGSAFGAILHQRGLLPLHANAVEIGGRAIAFMGHSGAGKSTLAAWFHDRGFKILADDVCVVRIQDGRVLAHAGIPRLRLWKDALERTGRMAEEFEASFDDAEKYNVPTQSRPSEDSIELSHLYLLSKPQEDVPAIVRLQGIEAVDALVANTYRGRYVPLMGQTQHHLRQCLVLVGKVAVFRAQRVWGMEGFDEQARLLEEHARAFLAQR